MSTEKDETARPPAEQPECSEQELEKIRGGTIVDEPDPMGRASGPRPIIEGPDPI